MPSLIMRLLKEMDELLEDVAFSEERQKSPVDLFAKTRDTCKPFSWSKPQKEYRELSKVTYYCV